MRSPRAAREGGTVSPRIARAGGRKAPRHEIAVGEQGGDWGAIVGKMIAFTSPGRRNGPRGLDPADGYKVSTAAGDSPTCWPNSGLAERTKSP